MWILTSKRLTRLLAALAASFMLVLVVILVASRTPTPKAHAAGSAWDVAREGVSVPGGLLVFVVPDPATTTDGDCMHSDGELFARTVDDKGVPHTSDLGPGVHADLISGGSDPLILTTDFSDQQQILQYDSSADTWVTLRSLPNGGVTLSAVAAGRVYYAAGASQSVASTSCIDSNGSPAAQVSILPELSPDPAVSAQIASSPTIQLLYSREGADEQAPPSITQLAAGISGAVYAFSANAYAAGITDLSSGRSETLKGWCWVYGGCLGGDGNLYAVGAGPGKGTAWGVYEVDPQTLVSDGAASSLNWVEAPTDQPPLLGRLYTFPTSSGVLIAVVENNSTAEGAGDSRPLIVWSASAGGVKELCRIPDSSGMKVGYGGDGSLLLYCGPAKNMVSSLNTASGVVTPIPSMTAPQGSYVVVAAD
jgi:hypothetical protein